MSENEINDLPYSRLHQRVEKLETQMARLLERMVAAGQADNVTVDSRMNLSSHLREELEPSRVRSYVPPDVPGAMFSVNGEVWAKQETPTGMFKCKCEHFEGTLAALIKHGQREHQWAEGMGAMVQGVEPDGKEV